MIHNVSQNTYNQNFGHNSRTNMNKKQKAVVMASAVAGMVPVLSVLAKRKGFSLNPAKIVRTPIKDWAIFKYSPKGKYIEFEAPQIVAVATGSVAGGLVGGALVDDKLQFKAKKREALNQILGNVLVPVGCVWAASKVYDKFANRLEKAMFQFKKAGKVKNFLNQCLKKVPQVAATLGALGIGIYCGNRVSNLINEKLYHRKVDRNIRATDFAPHIDDLCMATTMMNKNSEFGAKLGRVIPLALVVPGYQTGIAQDDLLS